MNSLNENPTLAIDAEQEMADMLFRGILRRAFTDLASPEAWIRDKAQRTLDDPQTEVARALPGWINKLLADDKNSTRPFKIMRAHRRGLIRERPGDPYAYPFGWKDKARLIRDRDHDTCADCEKIGKGFDVHHIVYLSNLGTNRQENLVTLCRSCHEKVHNRVFDLPESKDPEQERPIQPIGVITNAEEQSKQPKITETLSGLPVILAPTLTGSWTQHESSNRLDDEKSIHNFVVKAVASKPECQESIESSAVNQNKTPPIPSKAHVTGVYKRMEAPAYSASLLRRAFLLIYFVAYLSSIVLIAKHPLGSALTLFASAIFLYWQSKDREEEPLIWILWVVMYVPLAFLIASSYKESVDLQHFKNYLHLHQCKYVHEDVARVWVESCKLRSGVCIDEGEATESVYLCIQGNEITFRNFIK